MIGRRKFSQLVGVSLAGTAFMNHIPLLSRKSDPIKIGQIGTGHSHAEGKMETIRRFPDVFEIVGLVEPDAALRERNKENPIYQGLNWLSIDDLLHTQNLEAVLIETDLPDLLTYTDHCLRNGLHIHLDKPAGKDYKQFEKVISMARQGNLVLQMGYMFRYNPAFQFCLQAVRKGWLGEIFEVDGVISKTISQENRIPLVDTYQGSMMLLGCHLIDMVVAILGTPQKVSGFRRKTLKEWDDLNDNELAVLEYPKATATVRSALVEVGGWERRQFVVCGTKGTIEIKPLEPPAVRLSLDEPAGKFKKGSQDVEMPPEKERYDDQLIQFTRMVRKEVQPAYSFAHDLAVQKTVLQAAGIIS